jgi:protein disulfide-isomerase
MNRFLLAAVVLAGASFASAQEDGWLTSWEKAAKVAKQTGRPVLAEFTGSDWCNPCRMLKETVFDTGAFRTWAKGHVVLLRLDYPRHTPQPVSLQKANMALERKYQVMAFPTVLFLNPGGDVLGHYGFSGEGPSFWTKNAELIIKSGLSQPGRH